MSAPAADARRETGEQTDTGIGTPTGLHLLATRRGLARVCGDGTAELLDLPYRDVAALLRAGAGLTPAADAPARQRLALDTLTADLVAPLGSTRAVWGVGLNYHCKARAAGRAVPTEPVLYLKSASAGSGPDATVTLPDQISAQPDYEGEIALVIGARMHRTPADQAWSHVAAITAANDLTARDVMTATANPTLAKSFPGFGALGASVLDIAAVADRDAIPVRTTVNGELRQEATTADLIFPVPQLLAWITRYVVLEPGDVVLTGTPAGTGQDRGSFLRPGDLVEVAVGGVLPLRTRFRAETSHPAPPAPPSHRKPQTT
ncbi:fumarylacetoacetate hydrolase family protein [Micromonospora sp. NBC_01813]|uniref:fumarylacetoacetate hydrolase family protein n=1 Tax=Micromonospora sp. NBC_01813 TaxID=2975988 RepID=UPI002DDC1F39|nr:fumarylacetoacetate hydrolase family protein [Micromonospora sp. NBC_01813]WSA09167.1 fumarylacetoacetate hydrolase family protein [Micromonospora sp. NBC_01813]